MSGHFFSPEKAINTDENMLVGKAMHFNLQPNLPLSTMATLVKTPRISGMQITQLKICAVLENVTDLRLRDETEALNVNLQCDKCATISDTSVAISAKNRILIMGGRSYVNHVYRCGKCERNAHLILLDGGAAGQSPYTSLDSNKFHILAEFECRGARPISFEVDKSAFQCKSIQSKMAFPQVELIDRSWADYDEIANVSVGVYDVHYKFHSYVV